MKNITVSVDDEEYHRARVKAAEDKTSVSSVVREALVAYSAKEIEFERLKQEEKKLREKIRARFAKKTYKKDADFRNLTRDELHDRELIRRLQHPDL